MSKTKRYLTVSGLVWAQAALLAVSIAHWQAQRDNTLWGNGRWIVGKNTGKFVFHTFAFMFQSLTRSRVDLASHMGYQEILYRKPEGPNRQLTELRFESLISGGAYLWIELRKRGHRMLGCRLSEHSRFPGGFYRYAPSGALVDQHLFAGPPAEAEQGWRTVSLRLEDEHWRLRVDGVPVGHVADALPVDGYFGFRGSGNPRAKVLIRNITMRFRAPTQHAATWTEHEHFKPSVGRRNVLFGALVFSLVVLSLRRLRQKICAGYAPLPQRARLTFKDDVAFFVVLAVLAVVPPPASGVHIIAAVLAAEISSLLLLGLALRRQAHPLPSAAARRSGFGYSALLLLISCTAFTIHGNTLGRAQRIIWSRLDRVHPDAFITVPDQRRSSPPYVAEGTVNVRPGQPFFASGHAYKGQRLTAELTLSSNCTADIVFQQQAYRTHGDPEGEELPLQRRLLRLTTRPDVPAGLALRTRTQPAPFLSAATRVPAGRTVALVLRADANGVRVKIDGKETHARSLRPLGYGETGVLVMEGELSLSNFRILPTSSQATRENIFPVLGLFLPLGIACGCWLLLRLGGRVRPAGVISLSLAAQYPILFYLAGALAIGHEELLFMGRDRVAWLDLVLATAALAHMSLLLVYRRQLKMPALYSNLFLLAAAFFILLYVWDDVLPRKHPLRLALEDEAIVPGELIPDNRGDTGPWYSNNRLVGANTYVWKQRFGAEPITLDKPAGVLRIFVAGGSQAWGSGAANSASTYDALLENKLRAKGLPVEMYNAGVNGAGVSKVGAYYAGLLRMYDPDVLVLDIGLNDSAALRVIRQDKQRAWHMNALLEDYRELIQRCSEDDVAVLLSLEAMSSEGPLRPLPAYYEALRTIATEHGMRVIDAGPSMRELETDHFIWWDAAHYAPYGHEAFAAFLESPVEELVRRELRLQ